MEDILSSLSTYGYIVLFLYSIGGGMVALIAAGVLSYTGKMDLTTCLVVATVANTLGDSLLFYMGRYNKSVMMPYLKKHRRKVALAHLLLKKYGDKIIFIKKFIYGAKTLIPVVAGLTKYNIVKFNIINAISAALWALIIGGGSYMAGEFLIELTKSISSKPWIAPLTLFSVVGLLWWYMSYATKSKKSNRKNTLEE
ncbi:MAG: DedA family protein [Sulfurospirillaceae bacterium]|nr:DedA family protein [Sulfurospirillaceae bacterium]